MIGPICEAWESATAGQTVPTVRCRSGILLGEPGSTPRFAYVSAASPIEVALKDGTVTDRSGAGLAVVDLADRLLDGEVAALLAAPGPVERSETTESVSLPAALIERRSRVRAANVTARFLLRQIGLEEVSSHRGAHRQLYDRVADLWSHDLALCTDPPMMLSLGADRQRYVDSTFRARAKDRLPRAVGRLHDLGVQSYPRLVIV